jgi:ABC-type thiamin/hydroxymethylpyrimidine transport system permease subunit
MAVIFPISFHTGGSVFPSVLPYFLRIWKRYSIIRRFEAIGPVAFCITIANLIHDWVVDANLTDSAPFYFAFFVFARIILCSGSTICCILQNYTSVQQSVFG